MKMITVTHPLKTLSKTNVFEDPVIAKLIILNIIMNLKINPPPLSLDPLFQNPSTIFFLNVLYLMSL
jgi:hypothetical protein